MSNIWTPPDVGPACAEAKAPLTSCSQTGYMFLALVTQLFGGSVDNTYKYDFGFRNYGTLSSPVESGIFSPTANSFHSTPLSYSPTPFDSLRPTGFQAASLGLNPIPPTESLQSQRNPFSEAYFPKQDFKFDFEYKSPFESKPNVDFNYGKGFFEFETADSKKVQVKVGKSEKDGNRRRKRQVREKNEKDGNRRNKRQVREEFDFIIVGAGSAGCVLANRLSEVKKWKILLIEAGPEEPDVTSVPSFAPTLGGSSIDWNYRTQPEELTCRSQRGQSCAWFRGRSMGGSSAINYMVYMRGNKKDYDNWAALGNHGWSYHEVLPYFKKAENNRDIEARDKLYHSVGGPLNVERFSYVDINTMMIVQAFKEKGLPIVDFNGERQIGTDIGQSTSLDGTRMSANRAYIRPIRDKRPNLKILTDTLVTKVLIDPLTKTAVGVEYIRHGAYHTVFAVKEVILSSGSINSPKLLMVSGIGPKEQLETLNIPVYSDLRVGYNLQDHVTTDALIFSLSNKTSTMVSGEQLLHEVYDYYSQPLKKQGPLSTTSTLNSIAFINTQFSYAEEPDIQFHFDGRNVRDYYEDPTIYSATNIFPLAFYDGIAARPLLLVPKSRGVILLNQTDPVFGPPLIYPGFFTVKEDMDVMIAGLKYAVSLEETEAFRRSGASYVRIPVQDCEGYIWGTYDYFACILIQHTSTIYHPVGTCKMGPQWDKEAVVDPRLRVYGIKKLRVVDSSIMPVIVRGNTNAPTMMIGEKASDLIKEEWLSFVN